MAFAPWETPASNVAAAPAASSYAPWEMPAQATAAAPSPSYAANVASAWHQFTDRPYDPKQFGEGVLESGLNFAKGIGGFIGKYGKAAYDDAVGALTQNKTIDANGNISYPGATANSIAQTQRSIQNLPTPSNVYANDIGHLASTVMAPIADAVHYVSKQFSDDPDKQAI